MFTVSTKGKRGGRREEAWQGEGGAEDRSFSSF